MKEKKPAVLVWLAVLFLSLRVAAVNLGLVDSDYTIGLICEQALGDAQKDGHCAAIQVNLLKVNACSAEKPSLGTVNAVDLHYRNNSILQRKKAAKMRMFWVDAYIAPPCSDEMAGIARLAFFFEKPTLTRIIANEDMLEIDILPNVVQFASASAQGLGVSLSKIASLLGEKRATLVGPRMDTLGKDYLSVSIAAYFKRNAILDVSDIMNLNETTITFDSQLDIRKKRNKLIVFMGNFHDTLAVLSIIRAQELVQLGHTVVVVCTSPIKVCITSNSTATTLSLVVLAPQDLGYTTGSAYFSKVLGDAYNERNYDQYRTAYDACYGYCFGAETNSGNGMTYASVFSNKTYSNAIGNTSFDGGYSLMQSYEAHFYDSSSNSASRVLLLTPSASLCRNYTCFSMNTTEEKKDFWNNRHRVVIDYTLLFNQAANLWWLFVVIGVVLITVIVVGLVWAYRWRRSMDQFRMNWRLTKDVFKIIEVPTTNKGRTMQDAGGHGSRKRAVGSYALVGAIKAEFVAFRQNRKIRLSQEDLRQLTELKKINHDNIATVFGVNYNETNYFYILFVLVERGTLDDYIMDHEFNFDNTFQSAFIRDILRGLNYLHRTSVGFHGLLNTHTCLIDGNWVLKLSMFGFTTVLNHLNSSGQIEVKDPLPWSWFLVMAPELLRNLQAPKDYPKGTVAGDIYSLGMIIYAINYRRQPIEQLGNIKDIIQNISMGKRRPEFPANDDSHVSAVLVDLMHKCFDVVQTKRPSLREIQAVVNKAFTNTGNLIDQMIRMNEKYAQNLEVTVAQRNAALQDEQRITDRLLEEMLPASVAHILKEGGTIVPRSYESATVLFCQLVDFPVLLVKSTAEQIILFLNDVFTRFDEIIKAHDAYKVETTGETYMVASGVPSENEGRHIFEIADIALDLRENSYAYRVAYAPDYQVRVRIGFHCGPIAAGVIGLRSPRYCLFGDTVNFASRMQSNCPPNQIQTSEITALQLMQNEEYKLVQRGIVQVKGKGAVNCYWLNEHIHGEHGIVQHTETILVGERPTTRSFRPAGRSLNNTRGSGASTASANGSAVSLTRERSSNKRRTSEHLNSEDQKTLLPFVENKKTQ